MVDEVRRNSVLDYTTLLPPRKRLLAGLKKQGYGCDDGSPCRNFNTRDLHARISELLDLSDLSLEEVIRTSKVTALAAADAAASARAVALEKAAAAVKAKIFARSALELVGSFCTSEDCALRNTSGEKRVSVECLYKSNCSTGSSEADERLARKLHQAINSSPRISRKRKAKNDSVLKVRKLNGLVACSMNSTLLGNGDSLGDEEEDDDLASSKPKQVNEKGGGSSHPSGKNVSRIKAKEVTDSKKGRIKQKKLLLSQCCSRDSKEFAVIHEFKGHTVSSGSRKIIFAEGTCPLSIAKPSNGGDLPVEAESMRKCKKLKVAKFSSER